jgi:hypothetical protein
LNPENFDMLPPRKDHFTWVLVPYKILNLHYHTVQ